MLREGELSNFVLLLAERIRLPEGVNVTEHPVAAIDLPIQNTQLPQLMCLGSPCLRWNLIQALNCRIAFRFILGVSYTFVRTSQISCPHAGADGMLPGTNLGVSFAPTLSVWDRCRSMDQFCDRNCGVRRVPFSIV